MPLLTNYPRFSPSSHFNSILLHTLNTSANIPPINSSSYSYTLLIYANPFSCFSLFKQTIHTLIPTPYTTHSPHHFKYPYQTLSYVIYSPSTPLLRFLDASLSMRVTTNIEHKRKNENTRCRPCQVTRPASAAAHFHEDSAPKRVFILRVTTTPQSLPK